jgi:tetraacyldisaccharide 4'-kinase
LSFPYRFGFALKRRQLNNPERVAIPVVSIGNITVGGSGKTPLVSFSARDLIARGVRVGIVSSAYGRIDRTPFLEPGYRVQQMDVAQTGDEIQLLARLLPEAVFSVNDKKLAAARKLADSGDVDVIVVDDGFQHFKLARDLDVIAYDAGVKKRYLKRFPYGILRESKSALKRAQVIIITRAEFARDINSIKRQLAILAPDAEIYHAAFTIANLIGRDQTMSVKYLEDKSVFLFAGVGNFRALKRQVSALAGDLDYALELSDHQNFDTATLRRVKALADKHDSDVIVTTLKDWVKLGDFDFGREIYYLDLTVDLDPGEEKLVQYICDTLKLPRQER